MSMMVQLTTDEMPELEVLIEQRRANGLDRYDEWWQAVYRVVPIPGREHGRLIVKLVVLLDSRVEAAGLQIATPINVGVDRWDARVPDIGIVRPDTEMTSPAFHATAEMVIEVLSRGERAGEKLPFYAEWRVKEYLEIDLKRRTSRLLRNDDGDWTPTESSQVVELELGEIDELFMRL